MNTYLKSLYCFLLVACISTSKMQAQDTPNIIFIFADDMGIGDISNNYGKAHTPHLDRLVNEGMQFTDAHTSSSVCTPSRYSLLTGRYNWRTRLANHVFGNPTEAPLIKKEEVTVASFLKEAGYHTACIGKWHLGIGWQTIADYKNKEGQEGKGWNIDYSKPAITPTSNGFDYFFGITASLDMPPYVYIENEYATNIPIVTKAFPRKGAATADFEAIDCLRDFAKKSVAYIDERAKNDKPFFLYLPLTSPHTPIVPSKKWQGKSSIGKYGDFIMETDWVVGEVLKTLDKHDLNENTLVIFSTDNGCSPAAKITDLIEKGHYPNGNLRGHKADIYEGGHRVPFIVRWPSVVKAGTKTDRLTCTTDFISTCSEILGTPLDDASGVDGISFLPTLKNPSINDREAIVHHSINGSFAIRKGGWKLAICPGSGGWSYPRAGKTPSGLPPVQLFNLSKDLEEKHNLQAEHPEKVKELINLLQSYVDAGRSTPGMPQQNDREINIYAEDIAK
ncbi:sulfatase family protein [Pseudalgibacter alginicilyticus]|nr:arylsulfatase [Pseudalgibacter alginicilyticus]